MTETPKTARSITRATRILSKEREKMATSRDALRVILDEIQEEHERFQDAVESIDYAITRLSETV